jgi:hypothetical protein
MAYSRIRKAQGITVTRLCSGGEASVNGYFLVVLLGARMKKRMSLTLELSNSCSFISNFQMMWFRWHTLQA